MTQFTDLDVQRRDAIANVAFTQGASAVPAADKQFLLSLVKTAGIALPKWVLEDAAKEGMDINGIKSAG